jgi:hypothetical protein
MTTTPNPAKLPGGQAAALVAVADTRPERRSRHPPSVTPISGPSQGWMTTTTNPAKPPDGAVAAPVADVGMPPEQTLQVAPSPMRPRDEGKGIRCENR